MRFKENTLYWDHFIENRKRCREYIFYFHFLKFNSNLQPQLELLALSFWFSFPISTEVGYQNLQRSYCFICLNLKKYTTVGKSHSPKLDTLRAYSNKALWWLLETGKQGPFHYHCRTVLFYQIDKPNQKLF